MKKPLFTGSGVAIVTPFTKETVDLPTLGKLLDFQMKNGTDAIIVCGTTGEASLLTFDERVKLMETAVKTAAGRKPVIAGTGCASTKETIALTNKAMDLGIETCLVVCPFYNKPTQEGLYRHFKAIAEAVDMPLVPYNVPGRTGTNLLPATLSRLAHDFPNIVGVKEATGDMSQCSLIMEQCPKGFSLLSGDDFTALPLMSIGGSGVISVYANVMPAMCRQIVADWLDGNHARALENHLRYLQLMNDLFLEVNPIPVKAAMNMMGLDVGPMRLPLCEMGEANAATLRRTLEEAGLL